MAEVGIEAAIPWIVVNNTDNYIKLLSCKQKEESERN